MVICFVLNNFILRLWRVRGHKVLLLTSLPISTASRIAVVCLCMLLQFCYLQQQLYCDYESNFHAIYMLPCNTGTFCPTIVARRTDSV